MTDKTGAVLHLRRQSADVLAVLAKSAGDVVSKDELIEKVWVGVATTDDSLVQCIADIRRSVGASTVETFPKKGYRLNAVVDPPNATIADDYSPTKHRWALVLVVFVAVASLFGLYRATQSKLEIPENAAITPPIVLPEKTLAVLPFVNLSDESETRFFSDGLSQDVATDLSKIDDLTVISYASSFDFPDAESGFGAIAEELKVKYLVRGTVRHFENRVRINVSLIDTQTGTNVWAERYDGSKSDPLRVQEDVTRKIVTALSLKLDANIFANQRLEPDAYYLLLRGLEPLRTFSAEGNREARAFFEDAVSLDPQYARAHANIAITYGRETILNQSSEVSQETINKGLESAVRSIQLDPNNPHAYFALGVLNMALREYETALGAARHAIRLNQNYSDGYALLAEAGMYEGDLSEALSAIKHAKLLHPHHTATYDWIEGHILFQLGRPQDALPLLEGLVEANPEFGLGWLTLIATYGVLGEKGKAESAMDAAKVLNPGFSWKEMLSRSHSGLSERTDKLLKGLTLAGLSD